jgi:hypothetical protein
VKSLGAAGRTDCRLHRELHRRAYADLVYDSVRAHKGEDCVRIDVHAHVRRGECTQAAHSVRGI